MLNLSPTLLCIEVILLKKALEILLGETLKHSFSPQIHAAFGIPDYEIAELSKEELDILLRQKTFQGVNVTIPYKEAVIPYCVQDDVSKTIGSVNTIVNRDGTLYAYNTDCLGFLYMTNVAGISFTGKKVAILGSGGTAKTAVYVAREEQASEIVVVSRSRNQISEVFKEVETADYFHPELFADAQIIVNTTPLGMYPNVDTKALDLSSFAKAEAVVDVVYNPLRTKLTLQAQALGLKCTNGLPMLVAQAYFAQRYFKGEEPKVKDDDENLLQTVISAIEKQVRNVVLIGMPGSGKSTIGKLLAERLGCAFVDSDEAFTRKEGITPENYILTHGEAAFRDAESAVIKELTKEKSQVIATGGGSVLREENRLAMRQNGVIVYLERELCKLATDNRPLSSDMDKLNKLYETRHPIYVNLADVSVEVKEGDVQAMAQEVLFLLESL